MAASRYDITGGQVERAGHEPEISDLVSRVTVATENLRARRSRKLSSGGGGIGGLAVQRLFASHM
jgi:hypothetical protein